jgi:hypothetical protein
MGTGNGTEGGQGRFFAAVGGGKLRKAS